MKTITLECDKCNKKFDRKLTAHKQHIARGRTGIFCSNKCKDLANRKKITTTCAQCGKSINKNPAEINAGKHVFCNHSCSASYNNTHNHKGYRRSKLEIYIENKLKNKYKLGIDFNHKNTINSELDIYIPSLKLAFELNGIFHYEPIFGINKLAKIQNNDDRKFQACLENGIELCIIDSSNLKYFKTQHADKFVNIIFEIIDKKLNN